jgi:NAD(P)-dependent dehydrogenase (short-subunit alcohol dehydrogenase family)
MEIKGNTFLVTGGSSGLGAACVQRIVAAGGNAVIADLNPPPEERPQVRFARADVTSEDDMKAAVEAASTFGGLRGLVNCAGIEHAGRVVGKTGPHDLAAFARTIQVNLIGTFNAIRLAAAAISQMPGLEDGEKGVIIITSSIAAFDGQVGQSAYAASKAGVAGMTLPLARDLARSGVRVVAIAPGVFDTPLFARLGEAVRQSLEAQVPFPPRFGKPDEYASLAEEIIRNRMLNGAVLRLDGGLRMAGK